MTLVKDSKENVIQEELQQWHFAAEDKDKWKFIAKEQSGDQ